MRKIRMIVLDDDEKILQLFRDYFAGENFEVITFPKPVVCPIHDKERNACPDTHTCADLFITDYKMPGLDGLRIIQEQIRMGCPMDVRNKALISGMNDERLRRETEKLGCAMFEKPFLFSDLKVWIDERAGQADLSRSLAILRREPRFRAAREPARITGHTGSRIEAYILNLSTSGLCLELRAPLEKEGRVDVDRGAGYAPRSATVQWIRESGNGLFQAGLLYSLQNGRQAVTGAP